MENPNTAWMRPSFLKCAMSPLVEDLETRSANDMILTASNKGGTDVNQRCTVRSMSSAPVIIQCGTHHHHVAEISGYKEPDRPQKTGGTIPDVKSQSPRARTT
jgi:hypothetical protein